MLQSLNNLRALIRPEAGLAVLAVLAAVAVVYLFLEAQRTGAEASELEERVAAGETDL